MGVKVTSEPRSIVGVVYVIGVALVTMLRIVAGSALIVETRTQVATYETFGRADVIGTWKRWVAFSNSLVGFKDDGTCIMKHVFKTKTPYKRSGRYRASAARREVDESDTSTKRSKPFTGIWTSEGSTIEVRWNTGFIDTMTITDNGTKMTGQNNWGFDITCTKVSDEINIE